jgi:hypothetical protein
MFFHLFRKFFTICHILRRNTFFHILVHIFSKFFTFVSHIVAEHLFLHNCSIFLHFSYFIYVSRFPASIDLNIAILGLLVLPVLLLLLVLLVLLFSKNCPRQKQQTITLSISINFSNLISQPPTPHCKAICSQPLFSTAVNNRVGVDNEIGGHGRLESLLDSSEKCRSTKFFRFKSNH